MGKYTTRVIEETEYKEIINAIKNGYKDVKGVNHKPNNAIASCLILQANLGLRIGDILNLKLNDIIKDGSHYRLDITEQKTNKKRFFIVPMALYDFIVAYCKDNNIAADDTIFSFKERIVQRTLANVTEILGYNNISTHSFRKFAGTKIYEASGYDIEMVRAYYQHASVTTTQRYIKRSSAKMEEAMNNTLTL